MAAYGEDMSHAVDWIQVPTLRLLVALEGSPSVGTAARNAGIAQPNASRAIALLERRTGLRVIERSPRGSFLTPDGRLLASWAQEVLDSLERFALGAQALAGSGNDKIAVGASQTIAEYMAPLWISRLKRSHPNVTVMLHMHNSEQVLEGVTDGHFDIGFIESPHVPGHLHQTVIRDDTLEVVVAPDHQWAGLADRCEAISLEQLAGTPLVTRESGSGTRALVDEVLSSQRRAQPVTELNSTSAIIRAVREKVGPAVLSGLVVEEEISSGHLVPVPVRGSPFVRSLRAVWAGPTHPVGSAAHLLEAAFRPKDPARA